MTVQDLLNNVYRKLGYTDSNGEIAGYGRITARELQIVNDTYSELWYIENKCSKGFIPAAELTSEIDLSERTLNEIMPYGVAMHLARSESDGDQQAYFSYLYNQKKNLLTRNEKVKNKIPTPWAL